MGNDSSNEAGENATGERKQAPTGESQLKFVERKAASTDAPDRVNWTVDLADPKFLNKVVATDQHVTEVLAVADSLEKLAEVMNAPEFRKMLAEQYGGDFLVHSGPTAKVVSDPEDREHSTTDWRFREIDQRSQRGGPKKA